MKATHEEGFGLIETVVAMAITFLVMTSLLTAIVASERSLARVMAFHAAQDASDSAATRLEEMLGDWDYVTAEVTETRILTGTGDGTCLDVVYTLPDHTVAYREWTPGDAVPGAYVTLLSDVTAWSQAADDDLLVISWAVRHGDGDLTVKHEGTLASDWTEPSPVPVLDAFGVPLDPQPPRENPCLEGE